MDQGERDFILESARRVEDWENTPRRFVDPYQDMTSEEKSKLLIYQQGLIANKEREVAELNAKLDKLLESQTSMSVSMSEMAAELKNLRVENKAKDKQIASLTELLNRNNQAIFGSKSQKSKKLKSKTAVKDRTKDKDDFDGTSGSADPDSTMDNEPSDKESQAIGIIPKNC